MTAPPAESVTNPLTRTLLVLTFSAGIVDAISFLALGTVFSAAMNGNILLLGFGVAGEKDLPVIQPLVALALFSVGAVAGGILARRRGTARAAENLPATIAFETALIAAAGVFALIVDVEAGRFSAGAIIAVLALAMGMRTATALAIGVPDLSTTMVTLGIVRLGSEGGAGQERASAVQRRVAAVIALFLGALAGALLLRTEVAVALFATAATGGLAGLDYRRAA